MQKSGFTKTKKGFVLTEFLGTYGIYLVMVGVAIAGIASGWLLYRTVDETQNVSRIYQSVRQLRSTNGYGTTGTDLVPTMSSLGDLPSDMTRTGSGSSIVLSNSWGGTVAVLSTGLGFTISYAAVPQTQCPKLVAALSASGSFSQVVVGSTTWTTMPVSTSDAVTGCSGTTNTIDFTSAS
jgi:hypothetical protein